MKESTVRSRVVKAMGDLGLFAFAIETGASAEGVPDICMPNNDQTLWIECKYVSSVPVRATTILDKTLVRPSQIRWSREYYRHNKEGLWAFTRIEDTYLLHKGYHIEHMNDYTHIHFNDTCHQIWSAKKMDWDELKHILLGIPYE